ncbi:MAG: hypothetical protein Q9191_004129 [Dirinaria sp. TL-2023a]
MAKANPRTKPPSEKKNLKAIAYEDTKAAKTPIRLTTPRLLRNSPNKGTTAPGKTIATSGRQLPTTNLRSSPNNGPCRDSGLAPSNCTTPGSTTNLEIGRGSRSSLRNSQELPSFTFEDASPQSTPVKTTRCGRQNEKHREEKAQLPPVSHLPFVALTTEIPTSSMEDLTLPGQVEFTKRGSMLIGGRKAQSVQTEEPRQSRPIEHRRKQSSSRLSTSLVLPSRLLSTDDEILSQKVRSLYEGETDRGSSMERNNVNWKSRNGTPERSHRRSSSLRPNIIRSPDSACSSSEVSQSDHIQSMLREENELAGGIEDWDDVHSGDVDRYGFILQRRHPSQSPSANSPRATSPDRARLQRVSTSLQVASTAPRRQRNRIGRSPSSKSPARSVSTPLTIRSESRLDRPASSQRSYRSNIHITQSKIRSATNRLPHNKDRRVVDDAGDMLTLPPGLADISKDDDSRTVEEVKRKEWKREEKWRKMAKVAENSRDGGGMVFEFDTTNSKLIERTWKGIPDRWRATAWHAFLTTSATKRKASPSDDELVAIFKKLLKQGSPDDVQIDIDVPRTINSHIMFRRRYRGGQRLLFRVLHCMSIYFPDTGYVQGMAALAATLLCYFDEEMSFVMLVRLWQLRGLDRLYQSGFEGLMQALDEFEKFWLAGGEVSARLVSHIAPSRVNEVIDIALQSDLSISPTAYGTRWYLTLFNYSIPFPAQLRVWDVFMLLGDPDDDPASSVSGTEPDSSYHGGLDVLHATSAALIDGTREILLDSDFENAMKVLTSWIPVRDEELLMQVAKAEWRVHRRKK